jgi:hypothetical protein
VVSVGAVQLGRKRGARAARAAGAARWLGQRDSGPARHGLFSRARGASAPPLLTVQPPRGRPAPRARESPATTPRASPWRRARWGAARSCACRPTGAPPGRLRAGRGGAGAPRAPPPPRCARRLAGGPPARQRGIHPVLRLRTRQHRCLRLARPPTPAGAAPKHTNLPTHPQTPNPPTSKTPNPHIPKTSPEIKVQAVQELGGEVELVGESFYEAQIHAQVRGLGHVGVGWGLLRWKP